MNRTPVTLIVSLGLVLVSCARAPAPTTARASSLTLRALDGTRVPVDAYRGKITLLDVWATWCEPCRRSLPFYERLRAELTSRGFEVLAVSVDESDDDVRAFLAKAPVSFPVFHDPSGEIPGKLGAHAMPTSYLLDRDGNIRFRHDGFEVGDEAIVAARVRALVDAK